MIYLNLFPNKYVLVLCSYVIDELHEVVNDKFPNKKNNVKQFLAELPFEFVCSPQDIPNHGLFTIRDKDDENILYSAILSDVDTLVTGDKDLLTVEDVERPKIISHLEFLKNY